MPIAGGAVSDSPAIGRFAFGVVTRPEFIDRTVGVANAHLTGAEMADALARVVCEQVRSGSRRSSSG